jgi:hypothetical protein
MGSCNKTTPVVESIGQRTRLMGKEQQPSSTLWKARKSERRMVRKSFNEYPITHRAVRERKISRRIARRLRDWVSRKIKKQ